MGDPAEARPLEELVRRGVRRRSRVFTPSGVAVAALVAGLLTILVTRGASLVVPALVTTGALVLGGAASWFASRVLVVVGADGMLFATVTRTTFVPFSELERCYVVGTRLRIHAKDGVLTFYGGASVLESLHRAASSAFRAGEDGALAPRAPRPEVVSYRASARERDALWAVVHDDFASSADRIRAAGRLGAVDPADADALRRVARRTANARTRAALERLTGPRAG